MPQLTNKEALQMKQKLLNLRAEYGAQLAQENRGDIIFNLEQSLMGVNKLLMHIDYICANTE